MEKGKTEFSLLSPKPNFEKFIFYLLVLLLPTQFGKHFWPAFSQVLGIRIDYLSPTLYVTDLLILILFLSWLKRHLYLFPFRFSPFNYHLSTITLFLYLFLNILLSGNPLLGFYGFTKILELFFLGYYVSQNLKTKKEVAIIAAIFFITVIGESLLAIAQYIHQGSLNGLLYFLGERKFTAVTPGIANASINGELILRPYGTFPHPNVLAGFLLCSLIIIYAWFEEKKDIKKQLLKATALLLGSLALFLTLSRVAIMLWIFLVIIALCEKLIKGNRLQFKKNLNHQSRHSHLLSCHSREGGNPIPVNKNNFSSINVWISSLLSIIFFISILLLTPVLPRLKGTSFTEEAFSQRADLFKNTLIMIKDHPLFGVGLNNFIPSLSLIQKPLSSTLYLQPVHNIFLLITAEIGIIGLVFFLWFLFKTYNHLIYFRGNIRNTLLILLSVILILGLFDHYWLTLQQGQLLFAIILGLCWVL